MTLVDDIKASRDEMAKRGRCIGKTMNQAGKVCVVGAVTAALAPELLLKTHQWTEMPAYVALESPRASAVIEELIAHLPEEFCYKIGDADIYNLANFNDSRKTTDEDMFNLFDKVLADRGGL